MPERLGSIILMFVQGHMTTYYPDSKGITKADISAISDFLEKKGLLVVSRISLSVLDGIRLAFSLSFFSLFYFECRTREESI